MYKIVKKLTGALGQSGSNKPIHGELTQSSMQKLVQLMVNKTKLGTTSRFLDVGCRIRKPNLRVAQYPGVEFLCRIEVEYNRWLLDITCFKVCLKAAAAVAAPSSPEKAVQGNTMFVCGDIAKA